MYIHMNYDHLFFRSLSFFQGNPAQIKRVCEASGAFLDFLILDQVFLLVLGGKCGKQILLVIEQLDNCMTVIGERATPTRTYWF